MKLTKWKLEDYINSRRDLMEYVWAALETQNEDFFIIACQDVIRIAKKKKWLKKRSLSWLRNKD